MSAEQHINPQDYELLSAYLDGELTVEERDTVEQRLTTEPTLQRELISLRNTVNLIHQLQPMTAPRDFTLTSDMVTPKNVIQLQSRRRRVRPDYLSLVASVLLMLFGALFMFSELSQPIAPQASAPVPQSAEAQVQDSEAPAIANAPNEIIEESIDANDTADDAEVRAADGAGMEKIEVENTKLPSPLLNQTLADSDGASPELRLIPTDTDASLAGEGFSGVGSEQPLDTFAVEESGGMATDSTSSDDADMADSGDTQLFDTTAGGDNAASSETQLYDDAADESFAEAEEPESAVGAIMMQTTTVTDTVTEADAIITGTSTDQSDGIADDRADTTPEIASQVSNMEENHTLATPTDMPTPPQPRTQPTATPISGIELGLGLLSLGLILLVASLIIIRRNRS